MNRKLIAVTLITFLICVGLGSSIGCGGDGESIPGPYDLTIASTACGLVTTPGEGTFTYNASTVVNLVATPDAGCRFVNWTGNVGTIANVTAATTTITMDDNYTITANFALGTLIGGVPDTNQPPTHTIPSTVSIDNYCAPMAMVNILYYWDVVRGHPNAVGVTAGLPANETAEYLGYFMDTNSFGSPNRFNPPGSHNGTYAKDISPGALEFVRWDAGNLFLTPPPDLPAGKIGYVWNLTDDYFVGLNFCKQEIDAGRPLVVCFRYWNPIDLDIAFFDPATGETIDVCAWGTNVSSSEDSHPEEEWECPEYEDYYCIGHAVTAVGYILNWDPDGSGPKDYVIVHDNWPDTPRNVAIPWVNPDLPFPVWNSNHAVDPAGLPLGVLPPAKQYLTISSDIFGSVTTPGEGTFTCDAGAVVNLVATPGADCGFVNWTGDVGTVNNVTAASTTIAMNSSYSITANFIFTPVVPYP